jgi:hypothetical protein
MRKIAFAITVCSFLVSCQGNDSDVGQDRELLADSSLKSNNPNAISVSEPAVVANEGVTEVPANLPATQKQPVTQAQPVVKTQPAAQAKSYGTNTAPNPAHGQPGHRCDIAVGAPLNSAPTNATAPTTTITNSKPTPAQAVTTPSANIVTPPGMNPPHGQPGHDCSIAVGAPLKKN